MADITQKQAYKLAGLAYLLVFLISIPANLYSIQKLVIAGDAAATAANFSSHELYFRLGIAGWLAVIVCDTIVAWALYILLKPINNGISLLAACFRFIFVSIFAGSFVNHFSVLQLFNKAHSLAAFDINQLNAQAMHFLNAFNYGTHISFLFFGVHIFLIGYLILKSDFIPKILGVLLTIASIGYTIDSFGNFISAAYASNEMAFMIIVGIPAIISEFSLTVWLLYKGFGQSRA
jgi:hypothetical protein